MYLDVCLSVWSFLGHYLPLAVDTAASPAVEQAAQAAQAPSGGLSIWSRLLLGVYLVVCCGLVIVVLETNTKNDGLAGMLGGGSSQQSSYHGKKSAEEIQKIVGNYLAVSFIVLSFVVSLVIGK